MQKELINPFTESLVNVLSTMASTTASSGKAYYKEDNVDAISGDVSGIMGFSGDKYKGTLVISFSEAAICDIADKIFGEKKESVDSEIADMVGEITNMVSGGGRMKLAQSGFKFEASIPTTIIGKNHSISHKTNEKIVVVPFRTDAGEIYIEGCFQAV